ncbi:MAG: SusC/RagA family TonB-linked outer membrane protein [Prevotella sp.]|nr:SusC/RagA family TonB-linked outer membrane protein [Prevotella sp.]
MKKKRFIILFLAACLGPAGLAQDSIPTMRRSLFGKDIADSLIAHSSDQMPATLTRELDESQMNTRNQVSNAVDAIRGRVAGLQVEGNGKNALSAVRLRGTTSLTGANDPLIIVDGVMGDLSLLQSVYPTDIQSFTILKDASETARYGSRGAAGVIDIKTKRGQAGKLHVYYNGSVDFSVPYKHLDMLSGDAYRAFAKRFEIPILDLGYNTDFQEQIERTAISHRHNLAFTGGGENSSYRVSLGTINGQEVIKGIGDRSFMGSMNLMQTMWDGLLRIDFGIFASSKEDQDIYDEHKLFYSAAAWNPTFPDHRNSAGQWDGYPSASQISHPNALLEEKDHTHSNHVSSHAKFSIQLLPELKLNLFGAYTYDNDERMLYLPTTVKDGGEAMRQTTRSEQMLTNGTLSLNKKWGEHAFKFSLFAEFQKDQRRGFGVVVTNFSNDIGGYDALAGGAIRPWDGTTSFYECPTMASFMGQLGYTFAERYSLNATLRADGSSKFGDNHKWGYFPSVSVAWDMGREKWFRQLRFINDLKVNAGLGWAGNQAAIDSYTTLRLLSPNGTPSVGQSLITTYTELKNSNPDLKWEVSRTFNTGLSAQLFNNRLYFSASYYYTKVYDMLYPYSVSVPPFKYPKLVANMGAMEKSGVELSVGYTPVMLPDMQLTVNANLTFQRNKMLSLSGNYNGEELLAPGKVGISSVNGAGFHGGSNVVFQMIGQPLGVFYLPRFTGFYTFRDYDDIRLYEYGESYVAGQATPKVLLGSNISFRYKNIDITLQANGAFGHKIYNGTSLTYRNLSSLPYYNVLAESVDDMIVTQAITDYWLESGDYLNIDYITLGWQVPLRKFRFLRTMRLSLTLNNVATITSYSGLTPMINSSSINATLGLDDKRTYPLYRTWTLGVSLSF